jgi:hypothetical protein
MGLDFATGAGVLALYGANLLDVPFFRVFNWWAAWWDIRRYLRFVEVLYMSGGNTNIPQARPQAFQAHTTSSKATRRQRGVTCTSGVSPQLSYGCQCVLT